MSRFVGSNLSIVKRQNRSTVLKTFLQHGPLSRSKVGRMTLLAPSTITNLTGELITHGLLHELGPAEHVEHERVGRPSVLLDINDGGGFVLGAYIGARRLSLSLGDLRADVIDWAHQPLSSDMTVEQLVDALVAGTETLLSRNHVPAARVFGLGVTVAGRVHPERGLLVALPHHPWRSIPLATLLASRVAFPVTLEDSRRAMALAEIVFGGAREVASMLLVHTGTTIGCGLVLDHRVYAGDHFDAGKLGHVVVAADGALCTCGNRGCLETIATDEGIVRLARTAMAEAPDSILGALCARDSGQLNRDHVLQAARNGDSTATGVLTQVATAIGQAIANLVLILDPSMVIVAGRLSEAGDILLAPIRHTVDAIVGTALGRPVEIRPSAFGVQEPFMAGLTLALQRYVYSPALMLPGDSEHDGEDRRLQAVRMEQ